jgi:hypothetical protein
MSQCLPIGEFSWVPEEELSAIKWTELNDDDPYGYIVKADLVYPHNLHDAHSDYPLAPERLCVKDEWLSAKQMRIKAQYNLPRS